MSISALQRKKQITVKKANNLTGIKKPSDIKDLPNGTQKTQKALKLPGTVKITTTKGEQKASVKWDVKGSSYDPSSAERQIFNVKGTVILPDGVKNPNKISTVIAVSITVNGYQARKPLHRIIRSQELIPMASMIPIQRSPLQQLVQGWIIQTRVREIPDISRRAGRSQRPVPGWRALYCNIPCQQAGKIYSESYLWTAEI